MSNRFSPSAMVAMLAAASLLVACGGGAATTPLPPNGGTPQSAAQAPLSATRAVDSFGRHEDLGHHDSDLSADPNVLHFTAAEVAGGSAQTVTISASGDRTERNVTASIAGIGNCPTLSSAKLTFTQNGGQGDHTLRATLTVTPQGTGPGFCTIIIARNDDDKGRGHDCDGDLKILVIVDCGQDPSPTPTATPTPTPTPTPVPTATPSPTPTPCTGRQCLP